MKQTDISVSNIQAYYFSLPDLLSLIWYIDKLQGFCFLGVKEDMNFQTSSNALIDKKKLINYIDNIAINFVLHDSFCI